MQQSDGDLEDGRVTGQGYIAHPRTIEIWGAEKDWGRRQRITPDIRLRPSDCWVKTKGGKTISSLQTRIKPEGF